jgi:broad specificity phosphatase PhoE
MSIYLIRHGETPGNRDRIVQVPETPLSDRGLDQAGRLAERLRLHPIRRILASDLARAHMTAQALSRALGLPVESEPLLQERNFGNVRGTPYDQLKEDLFGPAFAPPGGETWEEFYARVDLAWEKVRALASEIEGHLAVVTHGLVLHALAERHLVQPGDASPRGRGGAPRAIGNTSLTIVERSGNEDTDPPAGGAAQSDGAGKRKVEGEVAWRVVLFGCTEHLASLSAEADEGITGI